MSAAHTDVTWDWESGIEVNLESAESIRAVVRTAMVRQPGPARRPARCPECHSIIYSRRNRLCGVCSQPLPDDLLFSLAEMRRVEQILQAERQRHREWLQQRKAH